MTDRRCFFLGSKPAALFAAVYTLALSLVGSVWYLLRYVINQPTDHQHEFRIMAFTAFGLYGILILGCVLLTKGITINCKRLFHPWMIVIVMVLLFDTGSIALRTTLHLESQRSLATWDSVGVAFYCFRTVTHIFSMVFVHSYYRQMSTPKEPTSNTQQQISLSTVEQSFLELPPPYSLSDPSGFSPPPYTETDLASIDQLSPERPTAHTETAGVESFRDGAGSPLELSTNNLGLRTNASGSDNKAFETNCECEINRPSPS